MPNPKSAYDVCVLGGAGHIGLPLSILFATKGLNTLIYDVDDVRMEIVKSGTMPFLENDAEALLKGVLADGRLHFSRDIRDLEGVPFIVITIGTPVDEFFNPSTRLIAECIDALCPVLSEEQTLILRSTVSPGITEWLDHHVRSKGKTVNVAFCPERVVQGNAIVEMQILPQIVSGQTPEAEERAARLFGTFAPELVRMRPIEAEFAKLFCNAYRYIQFAATNQFYMLATMAGADYSKIHHAIIKNYDRMKDFPTAGFAAGPCLLKDTMQLGSYSNNRFSIGIDAMLVNEGLPLFLIEQLRQRGDLSKLTVGLLGMAFKANSDDTRSSLSYKLKKVLALRAKAVLTTDPHVTTDPELLSIEEVVSRSDLLILCVPHRAYRGLDLCGKPVVDIWSFYGNDAPLPEKIA